MAGTVRRRAFAIGGSALRHAVVPLGSLIMSWWVVQHGSMELWGSVVAPLIVVQLTAHLAQWGQRDLLIRVLRAGHVDAHALWRDNLFTRWPIAVPMLLLPLLFTDTPAIWIILWALGVQLGGSFDPLIVRDKRFLQALGADLAGLLVQFIGLLISDTLDIASIVRSFAVHQVVRAVLLWWVCGKPFPWPAIFGARVHLRQAVPFVLIGLGGLLATRIDVYAVTALLPEEAVGRYQVIAALFVQLQLIPGLLARPFGTGMLRMDPSALMAAAGRALRWGLLLLPVQALLVWLLLTLFFQITPGWSVLLAGSLAVLPAFGYVPLFPILYGAHREREVALLSFVAAVMIAIGAWILVPAFGLVGGLFASALGQWAQLFGVYVLVQRIPAAAHG